MQLGMLAARLRHCNCNVFVQHFRMFNNFGLQNILFQVFLQHALDQRRVRSVAPQERRRLECSGASPKREALRIDCDTGEESRRFMDVERYPFMDILEKFRHQLASG
ncbi:hypothetical protein D3C84_945140 [compost metagenome]